MFFFFIISIEIIPFSFKITIPQFSGIYQTFCAEMICHKDNNRSAIVIKIN